MAIFLLHGAALAQDLRCGETQRRALVDKFDRLTFNASANEVVSITVAPVADPVQDPNFDPEFQLQGPDGDAVLFTGENKVRVCDAFEHQCETMPLPLDGEYTIAVNDTGKKQKGTYTVTLEAVSATAEGRSNGPPTATDPAAPACKRFNDAGKADGTQVVVLDTPIGGVIDYPGETDTFTFAGAAGQSLSMTLGLLTSAGGSFAPRARLFDPDGQPVGLDCDLDEVCARGPLPADGVYTVKVFELSYDSTGDYVLTVGNPNTPTTTTTTTTTSLPGDSTTTTTPAFPSTTTTDPMYELSRTLRRTAGLTPAEGLGSAIAADDSLLLIGVPFDQTFGRAAGAAYLVNLVDTPSDPYGDLVLSFSRPDGSSEGDRFGAAVALLDDDTAAIGAPGVDVTIGAVPTESVGAVYLLSKDSAVPVSAPNPGPMNEFGTALAALGGDVFVGAPGQGGIGAVYRISGGKVVEPFDPPPSTGADAPRAGDRFGAALAARGDFLAIGAPADATREGRVFLFNRQTGVWRVLRSPTAVANDAFGSALTFVDSTLIIGAPGVGKLFKVQNVDPPVVEFGPAGFAELGRSLSPVTGGLLAGAPSAAGSPSAGGVVLRLDPSGAILETYRKAKSEDGDRYGVAVAANSTGIFVGVPGDDSGNVDAGAVYAYALGVATEEAIFRKRVVDAGFGTSIVADDATILVGAPADASGKGGVYAFPAQPTPCPGGVCGALQAFPGDQDGSQFGQSVALVDGAFLIGAPSEDVAGAVDVGASYLAAIGQEARPRLPNPDNAPLAGDQFGFAVASIENDLLIGAPLLGSTDTGVVFIFDKRTQRRRTTLRNPVPTTGDFFGAAIAADDDTVAVGAPFDGTAAWKAGAVYLFRRSTAELLEGRPLVSIEARERELFGAAVAMSPEFIVVGAPSEDVTQPGRAYVFDRSSRALARILENPTHAAGDRFGASVAIVDGLVLVGAPRADAPAMGSEPAATDAGAAYLFDPNDGSPKQAFENPERGAFDRFGTALSTAPSGLMISAPGPGRVFVYRSIAAGGLAVRNAVSATTQAARCGNGVREGAEQCDDGNDIDTDDCSNACVPRCCVIDPLAASRCNDYDPCTDDSVDPVSGACVNTNNGQCCTSDASCAGQDNVCRLCAGCSLFAWDCCDQGATCLLSSPECQGLPCFEKPLCECQGGLTCSDLDSKPTADMDALYLEACDGLRQEDASTDVDNPVGTARSYARQARKALKDARRMTKRAFKAGSISRTCRGEYLVDINRLMKSIPGGNKLRTCARQKAAGG